jgi:protein TIF31
MHPQQNLEELQSKTAKRRNKRKGRSNGPQQSEVEWASLTSKSLWQQIKADLKSYYDWEVPMPESLDVTIEHFHLQKISLLRAFCIKAGIQILLREYNFENKNRATFFEEDILNIFPVVKHINPRVCYQFYLFHSKRE